MLTNAIMKKLKLFNLPSTFSTRAFARLFCVGAIHLYLVSVPQGPKGPLVQITFSLPVHRAIVHLKEKGLRILLKSVGGGGLSHKQIFAILCLNSIFLLRFVLVPKVGGYSPPLPHPPCSA